MTCGELIRQLRLSKNWSVEDLASKAGTSFIAIYKFETDRSSPSVAVLQRLALALGVELGPFTNVVFREDKRGKRGPRLKRRA
jgi:transcriptional regulator with XRE-family HTH domain